MKDLFGYEIICDDSNNSAEDIKQNILNIDFTLKPTTPEMRLRLVYITVMELWKKNKLITDYDISEENGQMIVTFSFEQEKGQPESSKNDDISET